MFGKTILATMTMVLMAWSIAFYAGCAGSTDDPCAGVDCSGHGSCSAEEGSAICTCDEGYLVEGLSCNPEEVDPCLGVDCSGHGTCSSEGQVATCDCEDGYHAAGLACVNDADPCQGVSCAGHGTCQLDGTDEPECLCEDGYHAEGLDCVINPDPCEGVTCSGHGSCAEDDDNNPVCTCETGYHPVGLDCVSDIDPCEGVTCCGHGTCSAPDGNAQCDCDADFHINTDIPTVCSPDTPADFPPTIDALFTGSFSTGTCTLPPCDAVCGEPGFDAASVWDMALIFKDASESELTTCSNALVAIADSQLTDPIELDLNFNGNCLVNSDNQHIGTAYDGLMTLCRFDTVSSLEIKVMETGLAQCNGDTGTGSALVYMRDGFNKLEDCSIYAEAVFTKQ